MRQKIYIKVADLLEADCTIKFSSHVDEENNEWHRAMVTLNETGEVFYMDTDCYRNSLWNDYNDWDANRVVIEPKVNKLKIPYSVC